MPSLPSLLLLFLLSIVLLPARSLSSPPPPGNNAFASLICDDDTLPAIEVLAASLRAAGHNETLLVLGQPSLSADTQQTLAALPNVHLLSAKPLPYPFESFSGRLQIHKPCRFLKLRLWGLLSWSKIVFLDADTMVRADLTDLFAYPGFSAVKDPVGMNYNTGVLVIEPSATVHSLLLNNYVSAGSYNVGDQGALNALVDFAAWTPLPARFNVFHSAPAPAAASAAAVLHFSGDAKPWNFWNARGKGRIPFAPMLEWCRLAARTRSARCHLNGALDARDAGRALRKHYEDTTPETAMSVLLATYDRDEWRNLTVFYGELDFVREVFVVWHKTDRPHERAPHPKVRFIYPAADSLNNRFLSAMLSSRCVYVCDDDVYPSRVSLAMAFEVWRANPYRLVGFYPRFWRAAPPEYKVGVAEGYNIVLTKGMFAHRDFLTAYNTFLPKRLADIVNVYKNCEDILFNMMAVGMTGLPPIAVLADKKIRDVGRFGGISGRQDGGHLHSRDVCVDDFMKAGRFAEAPVSRASVLPMGYKNFVVEGHAEGLK